MSSLSDSFRRLADQIDQAEGKVRAAASQQQADLRAEVDDARQRADKKSSELRAKAAEASDRADGGWHQIQDDWDAHVARLRQRIDQKKAELDRHEAEVDAEHAETDAAYAIDFAAASIEEAEYAVLDAILAREEADSLAATA